MPDILRNKCPYYLISVHRYFYHCPYLYTWSTLKLDLHRLAIRMFWDIWELIFSAWVVTFVFCETPRDPTWTTMYQHTHDKNILAAVSQKYLNILSVCRCSCVINGLWSPSDKTGTSISSILLIVSNDTSNSQSWNKYIFKTFHQIRMLSNFVQTFEPRG